MCYIIEIDNRNLLQGDILNNILILGAINRNSITYGVSGDGQKQSFTINKPPIECPVIVLSHSCELSRENGLKVTSIILAPLRDISTATSAEKIGELIDSNDINPDTPFSYLKYYYLPPHERLGIFPRGSIVDFSKCFSYKKESYEYLLEQKILQLTLEKAQSMSLKNALFYYRKAM